MSHIFTLITVLQPPSLYTRSLVIKLLLKQKRSVEAKVSTVGGLYINSVPLLVLLQAFCFGFFALSTIKRKMFKRSFHFITLKAYNDFAKEMLMLFV